MQWKHGRISKTLLLVTVMSLWLSGCSSKGYNSYTHWLSTTVVGCDPVQLKQGICDQRKGGTP
jgi:hypothetical protein